MPEASYFVDDSAVTLRTPEVPLADWDGGLNVGGSNAPGIGINEGVADLAGTAAQFTLLDQDEDPRTPQVSQQIGGDGYTDPAGWPSSGGLEGKGIDALRLGTPSVSGDGQITPSGNATLADLAVGWVAV